MKQSSVLKWVFISMFCLLFSQPFLQAAESDYSGAPLPLVEEFLKHYQSMTPPAAADAEVADKADSLWRNLRKYLMASQAQLDGLQLDVQETSGPEQQQAISALSKTIAEREREIMRYLSQIQVLAGILPPDNAMAPISPAPVFSIGGKPVISIEMKAENLVKDPPMLE